MGVFDLFGFKKEPDKNEGVEYLEEAGTASGNGFTRFADNPIITPDPNIEWMATATFNPAAIYLKGKIHLVFRAQGNNKVSTFGYANSKDGFSIDEMLKEPIYSPRAAFEQSTAPGWNSGCEDPRITQIDDRLYMTYAAYDGTNPPRVALTSIDVADFVDKKWNWDEPKLISPPGVDDKDACMVKKVRGDGLVAFHRLGNVIWLDSLRDLSFPQKKFLTGGIIAQARSDMWDNVKIGIASPPLETERGWLLFYHAVSNPGFVYKLGAMLLDFEDPRKILARSENPLLEPTAQYEKEGQVNNIVFSCGAVIVDGTVFLYYGGGDKVVCVATAPVSTILSGLKRSND